MPVTLAHEQHMTAGAQRACSYKYSQSSSTRDDLNKLLGDDGLTGAVERQGQLVNHLGCKKARLEFKHKMSL